MLHIRLIVHIDLISLGAVYNITDSSTVQNNPMMVTMVIRKKDTLAILAVRGTKRWA